MYEFIGMEWFENFGLKTVVIKNFTNSTGKYQCWSFFSNKVVDLDSTTGVSLFYKTYPTTTSGIILKFTFTNDGEQP